MTDDRHADALGVTRRERRQEYQGTGGRDEEAPAPEGAEAPAAMRTATPHTRGRYGMKAIQLPSETPPRMRGIAALFQSTPARRTAGAMQAQAPTAQSIGADG